ncbi:hypothetical protein KBX08_32935 [Micromonospora sp. H61]|uniref:hypothetical protein n=1 Tax=Micromonospora sp. H61 TaxID=2824888 RepID=UPI001B38D836|nr:hypothetical protein [Micromonospora sp. H61]MBQ0994860.1 hypothetical protein [Micromonospora sp. H61]
MKPIDKRDFIVGVRWWQTSTGWPKDFHNADYEVLAAQNPNGVFLDDWWAGFLPRLTLWRALRPFSRAEVTGLLVANRDDLASAWHQACAPVRDNDITEVTWDRVRAFPEVVARLKPTSSPVFRSKFCHFLLPRIFPVFDNLAVGGSCTYERYFNLIRDTWNVTPADLQASLISELSQMVEDEGRGPLHVGFPMATKITELALIGRKHGQRL